MKPRKAKFYVPIIVASAAVGIVALVKLSSVRAELKKTEEEMRQFEREAAVDAKIDNAIKEVLAKPRSERTPEDNARLRVLLRKAAEARSTKNPSQSASLQKGEPNQATEPPPSVTVPAGQGPLRP